jgi:hypothetical protein
MTTPQAFVPAFGLKLDPAKPILFKIFLNKHELVPAGIPEKKRASDKEMDRQHAEEAIARGDSRAAVDGRVRPGRVDTGNAVYQNVPAVQIGSIRSLLALKGYRLGDVHWFEKKGFGKHPRTQYVIVMYLAANCEPIVLPPEVLEGLRELCRGAPYTADVWDNRDTQTLNFRSRQVGLKPQATILSRDGYIRIVDLYNDRDVAEIEREEELAATDDIVEMLKDVLSPKDFKLLMEAQNDALKNRPPVDTSVDDLDILEEADGTLVGGE